MNPVSGVDNTFSAECATAAVPTTRCVRRQVGGVVPCVGGLPSFNLYPLAFVSASNWVNLKPALWWLELATIPALLWKRAAV
ncbi:hypothetical protein MRX96_044513 [Rhipicephalus microplus]